jgi:hypothetical protein
MTMRSIATRLLPACLLAAFLLLAVGCSQPPLYGREHDLLFPGKRGRVWAVAPAVNLSGQKAVDPILQADLLYQKLQEVRGITVIPVDRVTEVYAGLKIDHVQSVEQALIVCDLLGCDGLLVPTVTAYDPYDPPKFGGSLQLFKKPDSYERTPNVDPRLMARSAAPGEFESLPKEASGLVQAVGMFDAANGSVRDSLSGYVAGRHDPVGPMGPREYLMNMDRYVGFAYHSMIEDLFRTIRRTTPEPAAVAEAR